MNHPVIVDVREIKYTSDKVTVFYDNCYEVGKITTNDAVEAVAYMSKIRVDNRIWSLEVDGFMEFMKPLNSLYWLSGGDEFWTTSKNEWVEFIDNYIERFNDFETDFGNCKTLGDIKDVIHKKYNLDTMYEFYLSI